MTARQLALDLPCRGAMGMEDFLLSPCNRDAVRLIDRWPDWDDAVLLVGGPAACGKTHLLNVWRQRSAARMLDETTLKALAAGHAVLPPGAVVAVDGLGQKHSEAGLFHLINWVRETAGFLLITGRGVPSRWDVGLADLRSRLRAAPQVVIAQPDDALLRAVLAKLFSDRQLKVAPAVIDYLSRHMERTFDSARRLVGEIDSRSLTAKDAITIRLVKKILAGG